MTSIEHAQREQIFALSWAYQQVIGSINTRYLQHINPNKQIENLKKSHKEGYFTFIQNRWYTDILTFLHWYSVNHETGFSFLDVGAGIGNVMLLAHAMHYSARGIEYRKDYKKHTIANEVCGIWYGKAEDYDSYHTHNIIYFYQPIQDPKKMMELEKKIIEEMNIEAFVITPYLTLLRYNEEQYVVSRLKEFHIPDTHGLHVYRKRENILLNPKEEI